jgi:hypothetical protein
MTTPIHAFYLRSDQHTRETIRDILLELHLDQLWLRVSTLEGVRWGGVPVIQLELYHLREGMPVLPEALGAALAYKERSALRLSIDSTRTTVGYELFQDGKPGPVWAGNIETFGQDPSERKKKGAAEGPAAFIEMFTSELGLDLAALLDADPVTEQAAQRALKGTEALVRGRFVQLVPGMGRWAELFTFHDRHDDEERAETDTDADTDTGTDEEHVALVALDLKQAERLWRRSPASMVYQFLRLVEPIRRSVLGPLASVLPEVLTIVQNHPPEAPLAAAEDPDPTVFEVLAMATALVYMVGDRISYHDDRFFPLLSLAEGAIPRGALQDSVDEIAPLGLLTAMTEVLPYKVPEGQMIEAIADEELAPLAPWAVREDSYEGAIFLLDATRLGALVEAFDIERFKERAHEFRAAWCAVADPDGGSVEEWATPREERDTEEMDRFEDTFVELQHTLALASLNGLTPALVFYSE